MINSQFPQFFLTMDWVSKIFSPKPSAATAASPSFSSGMKVEKKSELKTNGSASAATKRRHVEFATQEPSSTMLLPAEPSKKLQKVSATSAFESSPSLQSKTLPKHHSTTTPRLENAGATISGPSHGNPSAPLALKSNLSKKSSPVPSSSTSLSLQHLTVAERVSKFLKMKGDANEALAPLEVKMVTELLGLNPSAATISALDHSIQAFQLNSSFSKVTLTLRSI